MNPKKIDETEDGSRRIINGPRPSLLKLKKESHAIRKPSNSSTARHGPVIIYTESPKIIHTEARDFMALVQKLTGQSFSTTAGCEETVSSDEYENDQSVETDKKKSSSSTYLADFPLFTPNSTNLFCSPQTNMGSSISPSFMDLLKRISEY